jgi:hypothetical protein
MMVTRFIAQSLPLCRIESTDRAVCRNTRRLLDECTAQHTIECIVSRHACCAWLSSKYFRPNNVSLCPTTLAVLSLVGCVAKLCPKLAVW